MLTFNKKIQPTISQIKYLTLTMGSHPEVKTTCNFLVAYVEIRNFSMILGCERQHITSAYLSLFGTHMIVPHNHKDFIIMREP